MPIIPPKSSPSSYSYRPIGDSISRFDTSKDIYSTRATPIQQKRAQTSEGKKIDSMETIAEKNDRLNPIKLEVKNVGFSGDQAIKIAKAGRYVFFAIAGPPFFLLFSLPKFALKIAWPFLLQQMTKITFQLKNIFSKANQIVNKFLFQPFRNVFGQIILKTSKLQKIFSPLLSYLSLPFKQVKILISDRIIKNIKVSIKPFIVFTEKIKTKMKSLFNESAKILSNIQQIVNQTVQTIIQPVLAWIKPQMAKIQNLYGKGINIIKSILKKPIFKKSLEVISNIAIKLQQIVPQIIQIAQPMINLCIPTLQFLKNKIGFGLKWIKDQPKKYFQNFLAKGKKLYHAIAPTLHQTYEKLQKWIKNYLWKGIYYFFSIILWIFKIILNVMMKIYPPFEKRVQQIKQIHSTSKIKLKQLVLFSNKMYEKFISFAKRHMKMIVETPKEYFWNQLKKSFIFVSKGVKFIALVLIAVCLIMKYWFEMLFELSEYMGTKITKSEIKS